MFKSMAFAAAPLAAQTGKIRHIDLIHHSHTDVGYTDLPSVTRELQVRFLDAAIEACLLNPRFRWTCEVTMTIADFWRQAPAARRAQFVQLVQKGQIDVMALPFNQAPFMNARQWRQALDWLPASLLKQLNPRVAMQNDVNGFPRAGALLCLDRGIRHLMMGINADMGGPPFRRPSAFHWKMPDGRKMFVWLGDHYGTAYAFFEEQRWQHGQAKGATTTLRPPYAGDHLKTDESSLRVSQAHLMKRLAKLEADGYSYDRLILSYTNQWRDDNDPAVPAACAVCRCLEQAWADADAAAGHVHAGGSRHGEGCLGGRANLRRRMDRLVGQWRRFGSARGGGFASGQAAYRSGAVAGLGSVECEDRGAGLGDAARFVPV